MNSTQYKRKILIFTFTILSILSFIAASCQLDVPIKEMASAKEWITKAEMVKAYELAPNEFNAAESSIKSSHDYAKQEKMEISRDMAKQAEAYAIEAYNKSIAILLDQSYNNAKAEFAKADQYGADTLDPDNYNQAKEKLLKCEQQKTLKQNYEAYLSAEDSIKASMEAQSKSLAQVPALKEKVAALQKKIQDMKKFKFAVMMESQLNQADTLLAGANTKLDNKEIKSALKDIKAAEPLANEEQLNKITLNEAKKALTSAEKAMAPSYDPTDYNLAKSKYQEAQKLYSMKKYFESIPKAEEVFVPAQKSEAEGLKQVPALKAKIAALRDVWKELKMQDGDIFAKSELATADKSLNSADASLTKMDIMATIKSIEVAEKALDKAKYKNKEYLAMKKIEKAQEGYNEINTEYTQNNFPNDLKEISDMISEANGYLKSKNLENADAKAEEALTKIDAMKIALAKQMELDKLEDEAKLKEIDDAMSKLANKDKVKESGVVAESGNYTVITGDCLWKIAVKFYKKASVWPKIYKSNKEKIKDPDLIYPGQKFIIP